MPEPVIDLAAYFQRIGYTGDRSPSFATLAAIHAHHARAIPFENLDVLLGRPIAIDLASIQQKLVHDRRGGYCFEQNTLLGAVLRTMGFGVTPLMGRVRWQIPRDVVTGLTHLLLRVETSDGPCLADVGFGSMSLYRPLRWEFECTQAGCLEPRRLITRGELVVQQASLAGEWSDVYQFLPHPAPVIDCQVSNWFTCTNPQSPFLHNLRAARSDDDHRYTLLNREFSIRHRDGTVNRRTLASPAELLAVLDEHFGLRFPAETRFVASELRWDTVSRGS